MLVRLFVAVTAACCALAGSQLALATTYDAAADFSLANNPNGVWTYGFLDPTNGNTSTNFTADNTTANPWDPANANVVARELNGVTFGAVAKNTSSSQQTVYTTIQFAPNQLVLHPNNSNTSAADVRFTAPSAMDANVSALFAAADTQTTTTDVHVFLNGTSLYDSSINGTVGSAGQSYSSSAPIHLAAGDVLDFAVGFGGNGYSNDGTSLAATVTPVPEPATLVLFALGAAGMFLAKRRRSA